MTAVRMLLFRCFVLRAVVSMPRNIFVDTPTLTSLLFAQKKSADAIKQWDEAWDKHSMLVEQAIRKASQALQGQELQTVSASQVATKFLAPLKGMLTGREWVRKAGKVPEILYLNPDWKDASVGLNKMMPYWPGRSPRLTFTMISPNDFVHTNGRGSSL